MIRLIKLFLGIVFFLITISIMLPFFFDKEKFVTIVEEKIKSELNADISFDQDVGLTFLPFPTLKINSLKYFDKKKIDLEIKKLKISVTWSSIFDLRPEVTNLEIFSPTLKINNNQKLKIKVNNKNEYFFTKIKKMSKNFQIIKIQDGRVKFNNQKKLNVNNLNAVLKGKDNLSANGKFDLDNLNSKIIFDFFEVRENQFDLIMQKKISGKNKLDFSGKVVFFKTIMLLMVRLRVNF